MSELAPIALFAYKRLSHLKECIESLKRNTLASNSDLFLFSDAPKSESDKVEVSEVRNYVKGISGFKSVTVIEQPKNLGLANSIIKGVTEVVEEFGKVIVLEDDLTLSPYFLQYMNTALTMYENDDRVISIHGYTYPVDAELPPLFFLRGADCWGWATWKRGWALFNPDGRALYQEITKRKLSYKFDLNGKAHKLRMLEQQIAGQVDSWAIRWYASAFVNEKLTLYPGKSFVRNIGADGKGTHTKATNLLEVSLRLTPMEFEQIIVEESSFATIQFSSFYTKFSPIPYYWVLKKILYWLKGI